MRLNEKKFYDLASQRGIEAASITINKAHSLSCGVFHGEVNNVTISDDFSVIAKGVYKEKFGTVRVEAIDKDTPEFLVNSIIETASVIEKEEKATIFKGSEKYHKKNLYKPEVLSTDLSDKVKILLEIEAKLKAYDPRISEVASVEYQETDTQSSLSNSYGLKLSQKSAIYGFVAEIVATQGDENKTGFKVFFSDDINAFDIDKFVEDVAKDGLSKLGSTQCKSKKYPVVLNAKSASSLLSALLSNIDAEQVQKHSSKFEGKLHQQVASKKITLIENPLEPNLNFRYYDDEGVATRKKTIINKGVLETYIYTLETAAKDGVEPTGNGYGSGHATASLVNAKIKAGKRSEEQLFEKIKLGVYITDLEGLHAGLNSQSGNFSLQSQGFMIRDGKIAEPLSLITVAGNLFDLFMDVKEVSNTYAANSHSNTKSPALLIKKLSITGK